MSCVLVPSAGEWRSVTDDFLREDLVSECSCAVSFEELVTELDIGVEFEEFVTELAIGVE